MNDVQRASDQIGKALIMLDAAETYLRLSGEDELKNVLVPVIERLDAIYDIIEDPEQTPKILERVQEE